MNTCPFSLPGCEISNVYEVDDVLIIEAHTAIKEAHCPDCHYLSQARHSTYQRHPADLSCLGQRVRLHLTIQRFRCDNSTCPRRTFAEKVTNLLVPRARRTNRLIQVLREIAFTAGGEAGARLSSILKIATSSTTLIRLIRSTRLHDPLAATVVGIDDWAQRKGHSYGTIIVDLESSIPIELLPDREKETVRDWFLMHPEIEIIARDRGQNYRIGVTNGAPQAQQVADRWHLLKNLSDALMRQMNGHGADLQQAAHNLATESQLKTQQMSIDNPDQLNTLHPRQALVDEVRQRAARGESQRQIAREMYLARATVVRYLEMDNPLIRHRNPSQASSVAPYLDDLKRRWFDDGCQNINQLWQELQQRGFRGSYMSVYRAIGRFQRTAIQTVDPIHIRTTIFLMTKPIAELDIDQQQILQAIYAANPLLERLHYLANRFAQMIRDRRVQDYDIWLTEVANSGLKYLKSFAEELQTDDDAVRAAMTSPWSSGPVEGQVNRLKFIKRQMYGRANFDLLRLRVLYQPAFT